MSVADMMIELYVSESVLLRVEKLVSLRGEEACKEQIAMARIYLNDAADNIHKSGKESINYFANGDEQRVMLTGLKRFTKVDAFNSVEARRLVSAKLIAENKYCF